MIIKDEFIKSIPNELTEGLLYILEGFEIHDTFIHRNDQDQHYEEYLEYYLLVSSFLKSHKYSVEDIKPTNNKGYDISVIRNLFSSLKSDFESRKTESFSKKAEDRFDTFFNNSFSFEFTEGDLEKVQKLLNELREIITKSELFAEDHRQRLLKRLEKLQSEMRKKISDLDRFWGLIGDAGVVIGKFGNDVKPIVDRIKELVDIVWRTQASAEELPSGTSIPLLKSKDD